MRIVHATAPSEYGGLERVVMDLAVGLGGRGHQVTVIAVVDSRGAPHPFEQAGEHRGVTVETVSVPPRRYSAEIDTVTRILRRSRPDVVHTHGYRPDVLHALAARRAGVPLVTTLHGFTGGGMKNRFYEWLQIRSVRSFNAVVAVSEPMAKDLGRRGFDARRLRVIRNAWRPRPASKSAHEARAQLGVPAERFHVGWVGRLSLEKGPDILLDALASLPAGEVLTSIIGDGPLADSLQERVGSEDIREVRFAGAIHDAGSLFAGFDAFVLSSRTEGTPMVLLEAMAAGVPVIATRVGGVPDVIDEDSGFLVSSGDATGIAEAICSVRRHPEEAARRVGRAREILRDRFAYDSWLDAYERVYSFVRRPR